MKQVIEEYGDTLLAAAAGLLMLGAASYVLLERAGPVYELVLRFSGYWLEY